MALHLPFSFPVALNSPACSTAWLQKARAYQSKVSRDVTRDFLMRPQLFFVPTSLRVHKIVTRDTA